MKEQPLDDGSRVQREHTRRKDKALDSGREKGPATETDRRTEKKRHGETQKKTEKKTARKRDI